MQERLHWWTTESCAQCRVSTIVALRHLRDSQGPHCWASIHLGLFQAAIKGQQSPAGVGIGGEANLHEQLFSPSPETLPFLTHSVVCHVAHSSLGHPQPSRSGSITVSHM